MKLAEAERLFHEALALPTAQERAAYLRNACAGNLTLHEQVDRLLQAHEANASLLPTEPGDRTVVVTPSEGPGTVIGRYKLLQQIGEGGMGVVYMAEQEEPVRRRVALKIIKLGMDTKQVVARFEAERQALALMDHPNIAKVLDGGATETGRPYFVMELVRGVPITEYCDKNHLSARQRLDLFIPVCQAIQHAHQKGVIHRDIKPSNVLVTLNDTQALPMVIDFGIAKATSQRLTEKTLFTNFAQMIGTPAYMSPEQAEMNKLDVDTRSDIYSLGVLLYELLTGTTPFSAKELQEAGYSGMQRLIVESDPPKPSTRLATMQQSQRTTVAENRRMELAALSRIFQGDLDWIVMKCLEKDRGRRYETANALAADLQRHLGHEPVAARPPSTAYRLEKAWRRNRLAWTAAAAVLVTLLAGISISSWQATVATRARDRAEQAQQESERAQQGEKQARLRADAEKAEADHNLYVANMTLAQQAWEDQNLGRLRQTLEVTKASPHRGFEWFYWQRQTHLATRTLDGHASWVNSVAVSPDGKRVVTGSADRTAKVWDVASGRVLLTLKGHRAIIESVAFSPDGRRIVTGSSDGTARLWDATTGQELLTFDERGKIVFGVAFSPEGSRVATSVFPQSSTSLGSVELWDAATGSRVTEFERKGTSVIRFVYSSDGRRIAATMSSDLVVIWDAGTGQELHSFKSGQVDIAAIAFSTDGARIATAGNDGSAKILDAKNGREISTLNGHRDAITALAFSPDDRRIVTASVDSTAKLWDLRTGQQLRTFEGHGEYIVSVAFFPDGQRIVTGGKTAKLWEAPSEPSNAQVGVNPVVLTVSTNNGAELTTKFCPSGQRALVCDREGSVKVWDVAKHTELLSIHVENNRLPTGVFSPDGQRILLWSRDQSVSVLDATTGRELLTLKSTNYIEPLAFSPDGQFMAMRIGVGQLSVCNVVDGQERYSVKAHVRSISAAAYSPDSKRLVTASQDKLAKVWDAASGRELLTLSGHREMVDCVAFSHDGGRIATGDWGSIVKVWDSMSGKEVATLKGHAGIIRAVAFSPDDSRIVTAARDKTVRLWDSSNGRELLSLKAHRDVVGDAAFTTDGQHIVSGSFDGTIRTWDAANSTQVAAWEEDERAAGRALDLESHERAGLLERQMTAQEHHAIRQWLFLGPIALATGKGAPAGIDDEFCTAEAGLAPKSGQTQSIAHVEHPWQEISLGTPILDFNGLQSLAPTNGLAYAMCYVSAKSSQSGLVMHVGGCNQTKVYWNGGAIGKFNQSDPEDIEEVRFPGIDLKPGWNRLLVKEVVRAGYVWQISVRFTDAQGNPVKGLQVTLDPEGGKVFEVGKP